MQNYAITTFKTIPAYTFGALFYLSIISVLMIVQKAIENRIVFMEQGKVVEEGSPDEIFENPKEERTKEFLRSIL